jgi:hypothetical protein
VVVSAGCLPIVLAPPASLVDNPLLGYSDESQFYIAIALGYFLWDIVISIACGWGPGFIVHGNCTRHLFVFRGCTHVWWPRTAILCALAYLSCCWPEPFSQYAGAHQRSSLASSVHWAAAPGSAASPDSWLLALPRLRVPAV